MQNKFFFINNNKSIDAVADAVTDLDKASELEKRLFKEKVEKIIKTLDDRKDNEEIWQCLQGTLELIDVKRPKSKKEREMFELLDRIATGEVDTSKVIRKKISGLEIDDEPDVVMSGIKKSSAKSANRDMELIKQIHEIGKLPLSSFTPP